MICRTNKQTTRNWFILLHDAVWCQVWGWVRSLNRSGNLVGDLVSIKLYTRYEVRTDDAGKSKASKGQHALFKHYPASVTKTKTSWCSSMTIQCGTTVLRSSYISWFRPWFLAVNTCYHFSNYNIWFSWWFNSIPFKSWTFIACCPP
jgi:hypothetical protein